MIKACTVDESVFKDRLNFSYGAYFWLVSGSPEFGASLKRGLS